MIGKMVEIVIREETGPSLGHVIPVHTLGDRR
jgi:hypothetical protein